MAANRNIIIKGEHSMILGKVHWMNIDSRKNSSKTFFLPKRNAKEFIQQLFEESAVDPKDVKGIVFICNENEFDTWQKAYEFRRSCYEFCQKNGIFYYSSTSFAFHNFIATLRSKVTDNEGDHLTIIYSEMNAVLGQSFLRENGRWKCIFVHIAPEFEEDEHWKHMFLRGYKPKKIIFMYHLPGFDFQKVIDLLKIEDSIILEDGYEYLSTAAIDKILHVMGENPIPYDIAPQCANIYAVNIEFVLISATYEDVIPFEKSGIIDVDPSKTLTFGARIAVSHPFEVIQEVKLSTFKCKKLKISLKIDVNSFYDFKVEPINDVKDFCEEFEQLDILKAVQKLPFSPRKVQITFNKHECWLLFTCDNGCAHETFDVDGLDKTPIYVAFTEGTPLVGKAAQEVYRSKPEYVVFDIIKLCLIKNPESSNWGFTVSKEDDPLMVTLQTVDGERKIAIEFLLALIIKHSLKATLMGHRIPSKWDKATIRFEDFAPNETLKNAFIKAGKLLKMKIDFC